MYKGETRYIPGKGYVSGHRGEGFEIEEPWYETRYEAIETGCLEEGDRCSIFSRRCCLGLECKKGVGRLFPYGSKCVSISR